MRDIIKENVEKYLGEYDYMAIRGTNTPHQIGDILETSYDWDFNLDKSTYETENPIELGGVSCINLTHENFYNNDIETEEDMALVINWMMDRINFLMENYDYEYFNIVASDDRNPLGFCENDKYEIILADAEVIATLKR